MGVSRVMISPHPEGHRGYNANGGAPYDSNRPEACVYRCFQQGDGFISEYSACTMNKTHISSAAPAMPSDDRQHAAGQDENRDHPEGMIMTLTDFISVEQREQQIIRAFRGAASHLIIDLSSLRVAAPDHVYDEIVFFARVVVEHVRRHAQVLPETVLVLPRFYQPTVERIELLRQKTGLQFELLPTLAMAKKVFAADVRWTRIPIDGSAAD
jgi:hypothetical protein